MNLLVNLETGEVLAEHHTAIKKNGGVVRWPGRAGELQDQGKAKWAEIPVGVAREDVVLSVVDGNVTITGDAVKRAAREIASIDDLSSFQQAKQFIRDYNDDTATPAQMKEFRKAIRVVLKRMLA